MAKNAYIISGPNGSGKTTFAERFLPDYAECPNFINADLIAKGLSPFSPRASAIRAGKLVLARIHELTKKGADFGFETTLSGKSYVRLFRRLKDEGYKINIFFLWIPGPDLAIERIKERVSQGGHDVAVKDVRRRFGRAIKNFVGLYKPLSDSWIIFNNSGVKPDLIARDQGGRLTVIDDFLFNVIIKAGREDEKTA